MRIVMSVRCDVTPAHIYHVLESEPKVHKAYPAEGVPTLQQLYLRLDVICNGKAVGVGELVDESIPGLYPHLDLQKQRTSAIHTLTRKQTSCSWTTN